MRVQDAISMIMLELNISKAGLARSMGQSPQAFGMKINRSSLRADEFFELLEKNGITVSFDFNGQKLGEHKSGKGKRLTGTCDGIRYDTASCVALADTFYPDGKHKYNGNGEALELYRDSEGRYLLAEYFSNQSGRAKFIPADLAVAFVEKFGR